MEFSWNFLAHFVRGESFLGSVIACRTVVVVIACVLVVVMDACVALVGLLGQGKKVRGDNNAAPTFSRAFVPSGPTDEEKAALKKKRAQLQVRVSTPKAVRRHHDLDLAPPSTPCFPPSLFKLCAGQEPTCKNHNPQAVIVSLMHVHTR